MPSPTLHPDRPTPVRSLTISSDFTGRVWVGRVGDFFLKTYSSTLRDTDVHMSNDGRSDAFQDNRGCRS